MTVFVPMDCHVAIWARERCCLSRAAAAARLKCDDEELGQIEAGLAQPNATLFRQMSSVYALPEATLLGLVPNNDRPLPKDFRSFAGERLPIDYETAIAIRKVQARQEALSDLAEIDENVLPPELQIFSLNDDPERLGSVYRKRIGFPVIIQMQISAQKAFTLWRLLIENLGIEVYVEPLGRDNTRGVSIYFSEFPAIIVDQNEKHYGARSFTLFHELTHLLVRQTGISSQGQRTDRERFCNRCAAAFLMPTEAIRAVLDVSITKRIEPTLAELDRVASRLCVTIRQIALRLEQLSLVSSGYYSKITRIMAPASVSVEEKERQGQWNYTYLSKYGHHLPSTVLRCLDRGAITEVDAGRLLNAALGNLSKVRSALETRQRDLVNAS